MERLTRSISFANVVSLLALFVALGGTAYAVATIDSSDVKNNSLTSKDVKNNSLTGKDVKKDALKGADVAESSLAKVPNAAAADTATSAGSATSATTAGSAGTAGNADTLDGLNAADLAPRAYAFIEADGDLVASRSKGIAASAVNVGGAGYFYCFELGFAPKVVVATAEAAFTDVRDVLRSSDQDPSCGDGTHDLVLETVDGAGAGTASAFSVIIY